jgi:hypothetical protein
MVQSMTPTPLHLRYERKFMPPAMSLGEVLAIIHRHPAMFREAYPPRSVNNVYLDSPALDDYHDHVHGVAFRAKTRIRWYGPCRPTLDQPVLEHKVKRGAVGGKLSHRLPALQLAPHDLRGVVAAIRSCADAPAMLRTIADARLPSLVNRYQRRYYLSADGRFRLTVDWDLGLATFPRFLVGGALSFADPMVIVELKYAACCDASAAAAVSNALPFRMARCSKYVLGIHRLASGSLA